MPPGDAASIIMPTASTGGSWNASTRPKQIAGSRISWQTQGDDHRLRLLEHSGEVGEGEAQPQAEHDDSEGDGQPDGGQR